MIYQIKKTNPVYFLILLFLLINSCSIFKEVKFFDEEIPQVYLEKIWKKAIGHDSNNFYSNLMPVLKNDILFVADKKGIVKSININSGKTNWEKKLLLNNQTVLPSSGITIYNKTLYIGSEEGVLYALNINNGSIKWFKKLNSEILSLPIISNEFVIVHANNGVLYAMNKNTGDIIWHNKLYEKKSISLRGTSTPVLLNSIAFIGSDNGVIYSININTGKIIWQKKIINIKHNKFNDIHQTPIILGDIMYIMSENGLLTYIDPYTSNIVNQNQFNISRFLIDENKIYLIEKNDKIKAIKKDIKNNILWQQNQLLYHSIQSYLLYSKYLIVSDKEGYLYWININNGKIIYKNFLDSSGIHYINILKNNKIIIQNKVGTIYLYKICY